MPCFQRKIFFSVFGLETQSNCAFRINFATTNLVTFIDGFQDLILDFLAHALPSYFSLSLLSFGRFLLGTSITGKI